MKCDICGAHDTPTHIFTWKRPLFLDCFNNSCHASIDVEICQDCLIKALNDVEKWTYPQKKPVYLSPKLS